MSEPMTRYQVQLWAASCALRASKVVALLQGDRTLLSEGEDDCLQAASHHANIVAKDLQQLANAVRRK